MNRLITVILLLLATGTIIAKAAEKKEIKVMVLGTFHFGYPSKDRHVTKKTDRIDMLSLKRQREITEVIQCLKKFKPTKVIIETDITRQQKTDLRYNAYLKGEYRLKRDERELLGYRIAKELGHKRVYCVNVMSGDIAKYMNNDQFFNNLEKYDINGPYKKTQEQYTRFYKKSEKYLKNNSLRNYYLKINSGEHIDKMQGAYFLNVFHWEINELDYAGTDWQCARWNNRNMRIFRNISRTTSDPEERLLVIYGAGHHAHLRDYIKYSPFHEYVSPIKYLKKKRTN